VTRSDKRCRKIYRRMQYMLEDEEKDESAGREVEVE